jgi:hypothetical protein
MSYGTCKQHGCALFADRYGYVVCGTCDAEAREKCVHCGRKGGVARYDKHGIYYSRLCGRCWRERKSGLSAEHFEVSR